MSAQRGSDRRQAHLGRPGGLPERRCGAERRKLQLTEAAIAELEARLAILAPEGDDTKEDGSGWDKRIIPLK